MRRRELMFVASMSMICNAICLAESLDRTTLTDSEKGLLALIGSANRANRLLLNSFDCRYSFEIALPSRDGIAADDRNVRVISKTGRYAFSADKDYCRETLQDGTVLHYVRNGSDSRVRSSTLLNPHDMVMIASTPEAQLRPGTQDPWTVVDNGLSAQLDRLDEKKYGRVASVAQIRSDNGQYAELVILQDFTLPDGSTSRSKIRLWYSPKDGYMPVKYTFEATDKSGVSGSGQVKAIRQYDIQGNTLYLPTEFYEQTTNGQDIVRTMHYSVDVNSVRINPDFPDDFFTIEIRPDDQVINKDVDTELQGPGGRDFYIGLGKKELDLPPKAPTEVEKQNPGSSKSIDLCSDVQLALILIPKGSFVMGSPDNEVGYPSNILERLRNKNLPTRNSAEGPPHQAVVPKAFYMARYEVTCEQYRCFQPPIEILCARAKTTNAPRLRHGMR